MRTKQSQLYNFIEPRLGYSQGEVFKLSSWKKRILARDGNACQNCGNQIRDSYRKRVFSNEAHHVIPRHFGGRNTLANGITLCKFCHQYFDYMFFSQNRDYYELIREKHRIARLEEIMRLMERRFISYLRHIILDY